MRFAIALAAGAILLSSCDSNRVFEDHKDFEKRVWAERDSAVFNFRIEATDAPYNLFYTVRNSVDYPYARLFVDYTLRDSAGHLLGRALSTAHLFDLKTGEPFGRSGLGDLYDHREPILENYEFTQPGRYSVTLRQYMRQDSLPGVLAVGVRVETAKK